jgi:hypothetical protein
MAGRSQLPVQIMENQTRFDLNAAIENWRNELAAQPSLASDDRRELETHLRDAIAGFQQRGLNDEESFWLASRRVGQPQQLDEEFVKADPAKVWRERVFWMALGLIVFEQMWIPALTANIALDYLSPGLRGLYGNSGFWLTIMAVLIIGISLVRGWFVPSMKPIWFPKNPFQLVALVAVLVVLSISLTDMEILNQSFHNSQRVVSSYSHVDPVTWKSWFHWKEFVVLFRTIALHNLQSCVAPLVFLVLFFPKRNPKTPKFA